MYGALGSAGWKPEKKPRTESVGERAAPAAFLEFLEGTGSTMHQCRGKGVLREGRAGQGGPRWRGLSGELRTGGLGRSRPAVLEHTYHRGAGKGVQGAAGNGALNMLSGLEFTQGVKGLIDPTQVAPGPVTMSPLFREKPHRLALEFSKAHLRASVPGLPPCRHCDHFQVPAETRKLREGK